MFLKQLLILVLSLAALAIALPAPEVPAGLLVLEEVETGNGTVTWYGDASPAKRPGAGAALERRQCGAYNVLCGPIHFANSGVCNLLILHITSIGDTGIPYSPRSVCITTAGGKCCVSWAHPVSDAIKSSLIPAAKDVLSTCDQGGVVSGQSRNTIIGQTCTTQCLSNRATGCN
ncbi:hypothetical protein VTK56DRAFT_3676 [Thermocarpiscus australiensis]